MQTADLEGRFRAVLGERAASYDNEAIQFAVDFTRLLGRAVADRVTDTDRLAMANAVQARTGLEEDDLNRLLDLALAPEVRTEVQESELRAFGGRFGAAAETALRSAVADEVDMEGFAERYGEAEALLLLDALFYVNGVDGVIDQQEIGRLQGAARRLGVDPMLVGALFRKHDVRHAKGGMLFPLDGDQLLIGRSGNADIQLPDPQVAASHCELSRTEEGWRVTDLGSGRPTLLNSQVVASAPFAVGDSLRVGPYTLQLDNNGENLAAFGLNSFSSLSVRDLHRRIGDIVLLEGVSFTVFSGEVIALVGPSGAGKTTLLNAIAGIFPADSGQVLFDGQDFHQMLESDRSIVGMVPQDDVIHSELTVEEALYYSGKLRLPSDVDNSDINKEAERVLDELSIDHIKGSRIGDALTRGISGGQRKRASVGQELLTRTTKVLFLDEPTSGLDPQTAQDIVSLIRQLADGGRIVFLVTHDVTPSVMSMIDHLMVLAPGGRLAWFGPPDDAPGYFGVRSIDEIFSRLPDEQPEEWGRRYRDGSAFKKFVATREHLLGLDGIEIAQTVRRQRSTRSPFRQFWTLTQRYTKVKLRDRSGLAVLMLQAPLLAMAMAVVFPDPDMSAFFMLVLSALWFGASGSIRELISDRTIWRRERRVGLGVLPFMASKVVVLSVLTFIQCLVLTGIFYVALDLGGECGADLTSFRHRGSGCYGEWGFSFPKLLSVTTLTGWAGMSMGLFLSSLFTSSEAAVGSLPLVLIPQITFGGLLVYVKEMTVLAKGVSYAMITRYAFHATLLCGEVVARRDPRGGDHRPHQGLMPGGLNNLGFRDSSLPVEDTGVSLELLLAVLALWAVGFLFGATFFTWRDNNR